MIVKNKNAFTMIELVLVIVLIGILSAIALPKFFDLRSKTELANLKAEIEGINAKTNSELLKNIIIGQNNSYEKFDENDIPENGVIFTKLFQDGLKDGNKNKGWYYLGKKGKNDSSFTVVDTSYIVSKAYEDYLNKQKISDRSVDGVYLLYKYSISKDIYFNFLYRSISSKFVCVEAVCNKCSQAKKDTINNMINCEIAVK